jgi:3-oxoisoapionate kinase
LEQINLKKDNNILLAFYGDDFTGSTDALECITLAGAKALLFIEPPTSEELNRYPNLDVIGVAGKTRSLPTGAMEEVLIPAFKQLLATGALQIHYKVCSTFDSSSAIGSIGKAIDCGAEICSTSLIPVLGGTPALGRYCLFGNLFAQMGIGTQGDIFRLDRHPSMKNHPVTPALESDLHMLISHQTDKKIGLIDILKIDTPHQQWISTIQNDTEVVVVDVLHESQLGNIGAWLANLQQGDKPVFSIGSSGIEMALGKYYNTIQRFQPRLSWNHPGCSSPLLVVSGSCSPITAAQIQWAKNIGFEEVILHETSIHENGNVEPTLVQQVKTLLEKQTSVILHTGDKQSINLSAEKMGTALGTIAKELVTLTGIKRVGFSGGDTSSYAARALGIDAVEMMAPLVKGAPLCRAFSKYPSINGLEVNFKGGQVGGENYFQLLQNGGIQP